MERRSFIYALMVSGMILNGCQETSTLSSIEAKEKAVVSGETASPTTLLFTCDEGRSYEIRSHAYGGGKARFTLSIPQESVCRLWVSDSRRGTRPVTFNDYRGNLGSLIYLRSGQVDIGLIRFVKEGATRTPHVSIENNDLQLMVAEGEEVLDDGEGPERHFALQ
ncbi:hypothetical protein [Nitratifractor sp.]|uniref:hypothetical protein n=1 Tax=Nitratifractor sp. TaxID=2268144 RepID=UPI0025E50EA2|nr:hypothetical protein [Nitratifractor sp.]